MFRSARPQMPEHLRVNNQAAPARRSIRIASTHSSLPTIVRPVAADISSTRIPVPRAPMARQYSSSAYCPPLPDTDRQQSTVRDRSRLPRPRPKINAISAPTDVRLNSFVPRSMEQLRVHLRTPSSTQLNNDTPAGSGEIVIQGFSDVEYIEPVRAPQDRSKQDWRPTKRPTDTRRNAPSTMSASSATERQCRDQNKFAYDMPMPNQGPRYPAVEAEAGRTTIEHCDKGNVASNNAEADDSVDIFDYYGTTPDVLELCGQVQAAHPAGASDERQSDQRGRLCEPAHRSVSNPTQTRSQPAVAVGSSHGTSSQRCLPASQIPAQWRLDRQQRHATKPKISRSFSSSVISTKVVDLNDTVPYDSHEPADQAMPDYIRQARVLSVQYNSPLDSLASSLAARSTAMSTTTLSSTTTASTGRDSSRSSAPYSRGNQSSATYASGCSASFHLTPFDPVDELPPLVLPRSAARVTIIRRGYDVEQEHRPQTAVAELSEPALLTEPVSPVTPPGSEPVFGPEIYELPAEDEARFVILLRHKDSYIKPRKAPAAPTHRPVFQHLEDSAGAHDACQEYRSLQERHEALRRKYSTQRSHHPRAKVGAAHATEAVPQIKPRPRSQSVPLQMSASLQQSRAAADTSQQQTEEQNRLRRGTLRRQDVRKQHLDLAQLERQMMEATRQMLPSEQLVKRRILKHTISTPTLVAATSDVPTCPLPLNKARGAARVVR